MGRLRLAVLGFGRLGRACGEAIFASTDLMLAGIVRRPERLDETLPGAFRAVPVVSHVGELQDVTGALVCLPAEQVAGAAHDLLQHRIPLVECAELHDQVFRLHKDNIQRMAWHHRVPTVVGAGWDPGALSLFRGLFALLTPKGYTETRSRPGINLHHTLVAQGVAGVRDALCTELPAPTGRLQRYVYVELAPGAEAQQVAEAIRSDPLFLDEETFVFPVESVAALEEEDHGVVLERRGSVGQTGHQQFLLEARFRLPTLAAQVMLAAARALPGLGPGAHSLFDVPLAALWGELRDQVETTWQ